MTLSEYEERTLAEIETGCRVEDPAFAASLDWGAGRTRRTRQTLIAACVWVGSVAFVVGIGAARGGASGGILLAWCAAAAVVVGVLGWFRDRVRVRVRGRAHRRQ